MTELDTQRLQAPNRNLWFRCCSEQGHEDHSTARGRTDDPAQGSVRSMAVPTRPLFDPLGSRAAARVTRPECESLRSTQLCLLTHLHERLCTLCTCLYTCLSEHIRSTQTVANYAGQHYVGHKYVGHNYVGHNYVGHNYVGHVPSSAATALSSASALAHFLSCFFLYFHSALSCGT